MGSASSSDSAMGSPLPASSSDSASVASAPGSSSASSGGSLVIMPTPSSSASSAAVVVPQPASSSGSVDGFNSTETNTTSTTGSSSAAGKFFPGFIDHDPFAAGEVFESGTGDNKINWPSPISDESDDLWSAPSTQPTGGYYTPEVLPADSAAAAAATGTGGSSALYWTPVETTTSSILDNEAVIGWRYKQKMRGSQRSHNQAMTPSDDDGNVFSLLEVSEQQQQQTEDEFSAKHLAQEQTDLLARLNEVDKTKPGWL